MPNSKTATDLAFESYLTRRNIPFQFEALSDKGTLPDYLVTKSDKKILVECEEIENLPLDHVANGAGSVDLVQTLEAIRDKIEVASKQLKAYADNVDHLVVLIGKKWGVAIDSNELYWSMFGDPVIRVPLSEEPKKRQPAYSDLKINGKMRKNEPVTKKMYFPYSYVGAVGIIRGFNGLNHYKNHLFDKYVPQLKGEELKDLITRVMDFMEKGWLTYQNEVPKYLVDYPDTILQRIELVINPLSSKPLPTNIFNGRWDKVRVPTILESLNFR